MGRVVTSAQLVNFGTMPVAGLHAGRLGSGLGVRPTVAIMAGCIRSPASRCCSVR